MANPVVEQGKECTVGLRTMDPNDSESEKGKVCLQTRVDIILLATAALAAQMTCPTSISAGSVVWSMNQRLHLRRATLEGSVIEIELHVYTEDVQEGWVTELVLTPRHESVHNMFTKRKIGSS